ncbi:MAG: efflux RND transporter periplasmic adaptor subunit [Methylococcaceae bacterium]|nr:efflux RND transporter periplasmic adaptor subunit [Methylococcaceae bacterium]
MMNESTHMHSNDSSITPSERHYLAKALWVCWLLACNSVFCLLAQADEPTPVQTQLLSELALYPEATAPAHVVSLNDAAIAAQVAGQVAEVPVRVGDQVKAGAVLVKLACTDYQIEHEKLKAERQTVQAKLELAQWHLKQSELLVGQRTLPMEKAQERRAELAVLKGELNAHGHKIKAAERQLAACSIKAPFAGIVTERNVAVGQLVGNGTMVAKLLDLSRAEVSAQVSSHDIAALQSAGGLSFDHDGKRYPLILRAILPAIQSQTGSQEVRLDFKASPARPGAAGRLVWQDKVQHIATELLVKRGEHLGVFTVNGDSAHFHPLPDAQNGRPAVITLPPDTPIIVSGQYSLNDGSKVKVKNLGLKNAATKEITPP